MIVPCADQPSVLIVDQSAESRDVLRTVLERRGCRIYEASEAREGLDLAREHHPEVVVLDLETESADESEVRREYDAAANSLVLLGTASRPTLTPGTRVVSKPYHYGPLVRTIESLIAGKRAA